MGEINPARRHLQQGSGLYDAEQHHALAARYGEDPGTVCLAWEALALFMLGYPDQALQKSRAAIALVQNLSHSFTLAEALFFEGWLRLFRREARAARVEAERAIAISQEHEFPSFVAYGTLLRGWGLTESGELQEGLLQMRQGLADLRAAESRNGVPGFLAYLADAYRKVGHIEDGLILITEAQALVEKSQERWQEAEIYRLKGQLVLESRG
jgi:predicted ATPase